MKGLARRVALLGVFALSIGGLLSLSGCGSSSNDQGVSLTFLGRFADFDEDGSLLPLEIECETTPPQVSDFNIPLSVAFGEGNFSSSSFPFGEVGLWAGFINNITTQTVRMDTIFLSYEIPGATVSPPDTAQPLGIVLGASTPLSTDDQEGFPADFSNTICNANYDFTPLLPSSIKEWMNFNKDRLPEAPFRMIVRAQGSGVTSGGDRLDTNEILFGITIAPDIPIFPGTGTLDSDNFDLVGADSTGGVADSDESTTTDEVVE